MEIELLLWLRDHRVEIGDGARAGNAEYLAIVGEFKRRVSRDRIILPSNIQFHQLVTALAVNAISLLREEWSDILPNEVFRGEQW